LAYIDAVRSRANRLTVVTSAFCTTVLRAFDGTVRFFTFDFTFVTYWLFAYSSTGWWRTDWLADSWTKRVVANPGAFRVTGWRIE
jgi:hypothetical protein